MTQPLKTVLEGCRKGSADAIAELVRRYQPWAFRFAGALLRDDGLAEDAVQEAFISALHRMACLRDLEAFPAWLRQIVRTECMRTLRARKELPLEETAAETPDDKPSAREEMERQEMARMLHEAVASLPDLEREPVEMFYFEERSIGDISDALGAPRGTVKRRLHDARGRLRKMLPFDRHAMDSWPCS